MISLMTGPLSATGELVSTVQFLHHIGLRIPKQTAGYAGFLLPVQVCTATERDASSPELICSATAVLSATERLTDMPLLLHAFDTL